MNLIIFSDIEANMKTKIINNFEINDHTFRIKFSNPSKYSIYIFFFTFFCRMTNNAYPAKIGTSLSKNDLESLILECYPVRRPLDIPSMINIYGDVLSHSAILCVSARATFLIEFMSDNIVYIKKIDYYVAGEDFDFNGLRYVHDNYESQVPEKAVTLIKLAATMANYMAGKKFDTFSHNCHIARYKTMKKYGMKSINPNKVKKNILHQGIIDFFFRPRTQLNVKKENIKDENSNISQISAVEY